MEKKCDLVIGLSLLGYKCSGDRVSDQTLARKSEHLDLIFGGHTHTFLDAPGEFGNKKGHLVIVNQTGWGRILLGSMDIAWSKSGMLANPRNTMLKVS